MRRPQDMRRQPRSRPSPSVSGADELRGAVDILHREGGVERSERDMFGGLWNLPKSRSPTSMVHRTKMRSDRRRTAARGSGARGPRVALYADAAVARESRQHRRRAARQGPLARLRRRGRRGQQTPRRGPRARTLVHSRIRRRCATSCRRFCGARCIRPSSSTNMASCRG